MAKDTLNPHCSIVGTHEIYCCGSRVRISEKSIRVMTQPDVKYCPLHETLYGNRKIDTQTVHNSVERKVAGFGFCCRNRCFDADPIVAYGASEMISLWLQKELVDCAVVVCDGAGTVITSNGTLVQGIGARLTGIIATSPIQEVIEHVEGSGGTVLDKNDARIDQFEGVKRAFTMGFEHLAVSVAGFQARAISEIRHFERAEKRDVLVISVCNTRVSRADVKHIANADVVCASASAILRKEIGSIALLQVGVTIPVYALTQKGKELILAYLNVFKDKLVIFRTDQLPYAIKGKGPKLNC